MSQAINTRLFTCTDRRPARVVATGSGNAYGAHGAPRAVVPYYTDDCEGGYFAHKRAAEAFAKKYKWHGTWRGQETREGWIFVNSPTISFVVAPC